MSYKLSYQISGRASKHNKNCRLFLFTGQKLKNKQEMTNANSSYDDDDDFTSIPPISPNESRRTYLVTYSRADMIKFPDCD